MKLKDFLSKHSITFNDLLDLVVEVLADQIEMAIKKRKAKKTVKNENA